MLYQLFFRRLLNQFFIQILQLFIVIVQLLLLGIVNQLITYQFRLVLQFMFSFSRSILIHIITVYHMLITIDDMFITIAVDHNMLIIDIIMVILTIQLVFVIQLVCIIYLIFIIQLVLDTVIIEILLFSFNTTIDVRFLMLLCWILLLNELLKQFTVLYLLYIVVLVTILHLYYYPIISHIYKTYSNSLSDNHDRYFPLYLVPFFSHHLKIHYEIQLELFQTKIRTTKVFWKNHEKRYLHISLNIPTSQLKQLYFSLLFEQSTLSNPKLLYPNQLNIHRTYHSFILLHHKIP